MKRQQIETRIEFIQKKLNEARHPEDIKSLSRTLEKLIMLDADDEIPPYRMTKEEMRQEAEMEQAMLGGI